MGKRLVPTDNVLQDAYRRQMIVATINEAIEEVAEEAVEKFEDMEMPKTLRRNLKAAMKKDPDKAWDKVLYDLAEEKVKNDESEE